MSYYTTIPVFFFVGPQIKGPPLTKILCAPETKFYHGPTQTELLVPPRWGDLSPSGAKYHGGIYVPELATISFHNNNNAICVN